MDRNMLLIQKIHEAAVISNKKNERIARFI